MVFDTTKTRTYRTAAGKSPITAMSSALAPNKATSLTAAAQRLAERKSKDAVKSSTNLTKTTGKLAAKISPATKTRKYKGKYIGPDKYKGMAQQGKKKFKGKYAGPDKYKGKPPQSFTKPSSGFTDVNGVRHPGNEPDKQYAL